MKQKQELGSHRFTLTLQNSQSLGVELGVTCRGQSWLNVCRNKPGDPLVTPYPQHTPKYQHLEENQLPISAPHFAVLVPTPGLLNIFFIITLQEGKELNLNSPE